MCLSLMHPLPYLLNNYCLVYCNDSVYVVRIEFSVLITCIQDLRLFAVVLAKNTIDHSWKRMNKDRDWSLIPGESSSLDYYSPV